MTKSQKTNRSEQIELNHQELKLVNQSINHAIAVFHQIIHSPPLSLPQINGITKRFECYDYRDLYLRNALVLVELGCTYLMIFIPGPSFYAMSSFFAVRFNFRLLTTPCFLFHFYTNVNIKLEGLDIRILHV